MASLGRKMSTSFQYPLLQELQISIQWLHFKTIILQVHSTAHMTYKRVHTQTSRKHYLQGKSYRHIKYQYHKKKLDVIYIPCATFTSFFDLQHVFDVLLLIVGSRLSFQFSSHPWNYIYKTKWMALLTLSLAGGHLNFTRTVAGHFYFCLYQCK